MTYELEISKKLQRIFKKLKRKDKVRADILKRKIREILENPFVGKPLTGDMARIRRIHVRPFVLSYEILEKENIVRLLDYDHHNNIYG